MRITEVEAITIHIPLRKPVWVGKRELSYRDHTLVKIHTDEGIVGWGDTYGYGAAKIISQIVRELLQPFLLHEDPLNNERLWEAMYYGTQQYGRKGESSVRFEEFNPYWIEGPCPLNKIQEHARIREAIRTPIATGGQEYTRWGFFEWIRAEAIDIIQADAIVVGGITEWLKVAHIADIHGLRVSPHENWNLHSHLVAATPNALFIEYFDPGMEIKVLDKVIVDPIAPVDGYIAPPSKPGYGITYDEEKIARYRAD